MRSKYIRLGILIIVSSVLLIWGLSYLKGNDIFKRNNEYHIIYDSVDGLTQSNEVILSGYKVGQVSNIQFLPDHSGRLAVSIIVDSSVKIPLKSVAQIISSDIMGSRSIRLVFSEFQEFHNDNDTLQGAVEADLKEQVSMQVLPLKNKAEELLSTLDSAITGLAFVFDENAQRNFSESFENINRTVAHIERTTADLQELVSLEKSNIRSIIENLEGITSSINQNTPQLDNTLKNLSNLSDSLAQIQITPLMTNLTSISEHLNSVLAKLETDDNTMGNLLNDDQLYYSLDQLTDNLSQLMSDIRVNPERYLNFSAFDFGRKVYVNAPEGTSDNIEFKVHLISSQTRIPLDSDIFEGLGEIEEYEVSEAYTYLTGTTNSFNEIQEIQKKAQVRFPDAAVVAFRNGRMVNLERALKSLR
ncbi:MAG TPA: MlaD family protein [Mariniphaga sp.]|nr:MlaD family protein [Mariniphaga sp.]